MQGRRSLKPPLVAATLPTRPRRGHFEQIIQEELEEEVEAEMNHQQEEVIHNNEERVEMRDFARPMLDVSGSCIRLGSAARNYEMKSMHMNMLPAYHGLPSEDPLSIIRDFYSIAEQMPLQGLNEDQLRLR